VSRVVHALGSRNHVIERLGTVLLEQTGTRLVDWVDHLAIGGGDFASFRGELSEVGYAADADNEKTVWRHPLGMFPPVHSDLGRVGLGIRCEALHDAVAALAPILGLPRVADDDIIGQRGGPFRSARLNTQGGADLLLVERHGHPSNNPIEVSNDQIVAAAEHLEVFRRRGRTAGEGGFEVAAQLFAAAADDIGRDWACDLFFAAERDYWQSRNHAARVQHERQDKLGLGWANHDHHTYRSSRAAFSHLISTLEQMGFHCRERFYAGREAGWGAQVLEQPECRVVIFADVDLSPEELVADFAHEPLADRDELGTVGLWCELHGEAFLEAGMHHLESQFDFDAARSQLAALGIETMAPFTDFPFLRQAFTRGETWPVNPRRIERLQAQGSITTEQADRFRREGALGSHMEILERNDGYKGFNQTGVSEIITRTDPRLIVGA